MNFHEARQLAQEDAMYHAQGLYFGKAEHVLDDDFLEAEHCWMFFRSRSIVMPPERSLSDFAYVFGKRGGGRWVPDYRGNEPRLREYLKTCSDDFATHDS
jgi:hypothetical protein